MLQQRVRGKPCERSSSRHAGVSLHACLVRAHRSATQRPRQHIALRCSQEGALSTSVVDTATTAPSASTGSSPSSSSSRSSSLHAAAHQDPLLGITEEFLQPMKSPELRVKCFVIVRHGHSTWNEQGRIQGNTDESSLTRTGEEQAMKALRSIAHIPFDSCFASPHRRAAQTAELLWTPWSGSLGPVTYLDSLREADLGWFQGRRNEDIAREHPDLYRVWRQEPERFCLDGRYPVLEAFRQARRAWKDMLAAPGTLHLVVTHKSLLRAMLCTSLGLPPRQFRAIDISNAAVCMVRCNERGDMMLSALNLTAHLEYDGIKYKVPIADKNDVLAAGAAAQLDAAQHAPQSQQEQQQHASNQ